MFVWPSLSVLELALRHCLTLLQPQGMNDLCDCQTEGAQQPTLYITRHSSSFSDSL